MPRRVKPLSAKQLAAWKPNPARTLELPDGAVPGLWARLTPHGDISWSMSVRVHGTRRRIAVGKRLGLAEARRLAEQMRAAIANGIDPVAERKEALTRQQAARTGVGALKGVIAAYYETGPGKDLLSGVKSRVMIERVIKSQLPRPALDVTSAQLQLTLDAYPSKSSAQHAAGYLRPVMKWAAKRGLVMKGDPLEGPRVQAQRRVLTHAEAGALWRNLGWHAHDGAARFMLLTGARREEACGMTWSEFNLEAAQWVIPGRRRKDTHASTRRVFEDHSVPLPRQALELLERQRGSEDTRPKGRAMETGSPDALVFVGQRDGRLGNWPRWSNWAERRLGFDMQPHALRRTTATLAGDLGQPPHVVSALLGHRIGGALHAGYNQSRYTAEVADALQRVADLLDALAAGRDNVVNLADHPEKRIAR